MVKMRYHAADAINAFDCCGYVASVQGEVEVQWECTHFLGGVPEDWEQFHTTSAGQNETQQHPSVQTACFQSADSCCYTMYYTVVIDLLGSCAPTQQNDFVDWSSIPRSDDILAGSDSSADVATH